MRESAKLGVKNRTGLQMSPKHSKELLETLNGLEGMRSPPDGDGHAMAQVREEYIMEAEPLGTIPAPATTKAIAKDTAKLVTGEHPQAFMDKLAERCAFERSGTRLYDGILTKFHSESRLGRCRGIPLDLSQEKLLQIRNEEAEHFQLLVECVEQLGADPTAQTPSADLVGIESVGLMQAVSDPRTSLLQCLHAALAAELIDNAGWELLIEMAMKTGYDDMAARFENALRQEEEHLQLLREWYAEMTLAESAKA